MKRWHELSTEARGAVIRDNLMDVVAVAVIMVVVAIIAAAWRWL